MKTNTEFSTGTEKPVRRSSKDTNSYYIYLHRKASTGEIFYVGKGAWNEKKKYCRAREIKNRTKEWKQIGASGYTIQIYGHYLNEESAFKIEVTLIKRYGRQVDGGILVNKTHGGPGNCGCSPTAETREKLRARIAGKNHMNWGKKLSAETCMRKSISMTNSPKNLRGKKLPDEWVKNLADAKRGALNPQFGRTGELSPISKRVRNTLTGEIFESITLAAEAHGLRMKTLSGYLTGFRPNKTSLVYL